MNAPIKPSDTASYSAAQVDDPDGVKQSFATAATETALDSTDYNGALVKNSGAHWVGNLPRTVTISRSAAVGSYTTDGITLTGTYSGEAVSETLTPADADGDDILRGSKLFDAPPDITIPAQADTNGSFTIGAGDIGARGGERFNGISLHAAGSLNVRYGASGDSVDTIPIAAGEVGFIKPTRASRVRTDPELASPTSVGLTIYHS